MINRFIRPNSNHLHQQPHSPHLDASDTQKITTDGAAQGQYFPQFSPKFKDWEQGRKYQTRSGIHDRSKIEKIIADFLTASDLTFVYEPQLKIGNLFLRPDFYFPEYGLLHEHFGLNTPVVGKNAFLALLRTGQHLNPGGGRRGSEIVP